MKRILKLALIITLTQAIHILPATSQTIIDLNKGGNVRSKNIRDYDIAIDRHQQLQDSLKYVELITRGFNALHTDSLQQAKTYFDEALKLRPEATGNYIIRQQLAKIAEAKGDLTEAAKIYTQILKQQPNLHEIRADRAAIYLQIHHFKEAKEDCEILFNQSPLPISAEHLYFMRATAHTGLRHFEDARKDYEHVLRLNPKHPSAPILLALLFHDNGQTNKALNLLNLHLQAQPENIDALTLRASFEMELSHYEAARVDLDKAISLAPNTPELYLERATCLDKLGHKDSAQRDRLKAQKLRSSQQHSKY